MEIRLQKYLAEAGIASRRKSEELILEGRIGVNGKIINELGFKIDEKKDPVTFDGAIVNPAVNKIYIMLHKPEGYVTTMQDQFDRAAVTDLVKGLKERVFPVGRLDYDTSGLLIMTNDGDLTYRLTHPKYSVEKSYLAKLFGTPNEKCIRIFNRGIMLDGKKTRPAKLEILKTEGRFSFAKITIAEGRNRQIRKMCDEIRHPVASLKRISIGKLELGDLPKGKYRILTDEEIKYLKSL
ncbi:MAG: rRNA pseudouridine synthase [Firmicutes bacterium]|nr:rRNA pseudouridine synthase [Bacillota bacterium]